MAKIFLSYQREREVAVKILAADLETLGHTVWFDHKLSGGQHWWDGILGAIRDCDVFVFVLDPQSLASLPCQREYAYASALRKRILPILAAQGVSLHLLPPELSQIQFVDLRERSPESSLRLAAAFLSLPPPFDPPDPLPIPPEVPLSPLSRLAQQIDNPAPLSQELQSVLLLELKRYLADPATAPDAQALLSALRRRPDVFASIATEIEMQPIQNPAPAVAPQPSVENEDDFDDRQVAARAFWLGSIVGCAAVFVWVFFDSTNSDPIPIWVGAFGCLTGAGAWLAILVIGVSRVNMSLIALGALVASAACLAYFPSHSLREAIAKAAAVAVPLGAVITAVLHRLLTWWRNLP